MANISIDAYTLLFNPSTMTIVRPDTHGAGVKTYTAAEHFFFDSTIAGKDINITWSFMTTAEFTILDTKYKTGDQFVFDPQDGSGNTYNVHITQFDANYFHHLDDAAGQHRRNVTMTLFVINQI